MSNTPLILSHNYFDDVILFPAHIVTNLSADDVAGSEYWHVSDHLRDITRWTVSTTNTDHKLRVDCGVAKPGTIVVLDRNHNLKGSTLRIEASDNNWGSTAFTITCVIPTSAGGLPTDANGCLTVDGVWWKTFSGGSHQYWQLYSSAMGVGTAQSVTGAYLGDLYRMVDYLDGPGAYDYRRTIRVGKNNLTRGAVRVKREIQVFGELDIRCTGMDEANFQALRVHVDRLLYNTHPWWFCFDDSSTEGAGLMRFFQLPGNVTYDPVVDPVQRNIALLLEEIIPTLIL